MAHDSRMKRKGKGMARFVSLRMKKIHEDVKKGLNIMRTVVAATQVQQGDQNAPKVGNNARLKTIKTSEHRDPLPTSTRKSNHSPSISHHINKTLISKIDNHSKNPRIVKDKNATLRPSNGTLRPLELSRKAKMKQGLGYNSNCTKRCYSQPQANHLKAMPGLVHHSKFVSSLEQGAAKGIRSESGRDESICGVKDKNTKDEPLPGTKVDVDMDCSKPKRRRIYSETNDDVDDASDHQSDEDDSTRLHSYNASLKDSIAQVSTSFVSKCIAQQHHCSSKPIDEAAWSGILKVDGRDYILAGHLSTKSGEKVWNLTRSLRRMVDATKVRRSEVWPKRWDTSRPTNSDNIGLYFFPYKMRSNRSHDELVKEVMENDLALQVILDEAEMLIFSSSLLPQQYQTFQSKHYLWGVFRPRSFEKKRLDNNAKAATSNTTSIPICAPVAATNVGAVLAEALKLPTKSHTEHSNEGRINSGMGTLPGRVVSFVVRQTPRVEQLIQEMEREGELIAALQGEMLTGDWPFSRRHGDHI